MGDFNNATRHLTRIERSIYRDMLELYYDTEKPLPLDLALLSRKVMAHTDDEKGAVINVLAEFFTESQDGWHHPRCDEEIAKAAVKMEDAEDRRRNERERQTRHRERRKGLFEDLRGYGEVPLYDTPTEQLQLRLDTHLSRVTSRRRTEDATANQEPITNNQEPPNTLASSEPPEVVVDDLKYCPTETLVNLYHELMPLNPKVKIVSAARKSAIKTRWTEAASLSCEPFGYKTKAEGIAAWRLFFETCAQSKFLTGRAPPQPGRPAWFADIDFLFSPSGFTKTLENKYNRDDEQKPKKDEWI